MPPKANVLIVEDDIALQELIHSTLEVEGYGVTCASDSKAGLRQAAQGHPDIILFDTGMPTMGGYTFIESYHQRLQVHVPIIVLVTPTWDYRKIFGISGFVKKPVEIAILVVTIEGVLKRYKNNQDYTLTLSALKNTL